MLGGWIGGLPQECEIVSEPYNKTVAVGILGERVETFPFIDIMYGGIKRSYLYFEKNVDNDIEERQLKQQVLNEESEMLIKWRV